MGPSILLCGGTGELGGAIARRLAASGVAFRALVRPGTDASTLDAMGAEVVRGDFRDPASLTTAVTGIRTVISTVNAMARALGGARDLTIHDVDELGYQHLIDACEAAGVERFLFASVLGLAGAATPFTRAKEATERRLRESPLREVIVRADAFQEVWFSPGGGFDWPHDRVTIYGTGRSRHAYVAEGDVADAMVRLALADDPPRVVEVAGPEAVSPEEAVTEFQHELGRPVKVSHIPRVALRAGSLLLQRPRPALASVMGMALASDRFDSVVRDEALRELGIVARPVGAYIKDRAAAAKARTPTAS